MIKMLQYKMYPAGELRCPTTALVLISPQNICYGTHQKVVAKALLMSTHNIGFHGEIRKIIWGYPSYLELSINF